MSDQLSLGKCNDMYKETITQAAAAAGDDPPTKNSSSVKSGPVFVLSFLFSNLSRMQAIW